MSSGESLDGDSSTASDDLHFTKVQAELLAYGFCLALFAVADFFGGSVYELYILVDAAGSFCFPVTVLYFFYPKAALWLAVLTCVALIMYWVHHMQRMRSKLTVVMLFSTLYVLLQSSADLRDHYR
eukprot:Rhum_TRINITY_DN11085_c0_g1::Rhum_TRINITY_DN11085_c0_g1_i1::g.42269::m.42269